jgi:WhiB family redox-sensing transcriptional regulator
MYLRVSRTAFTCSGAPHDSAISVAWLFDRLGEGWQRDALCREHPELEFVRTGRGDYPAAMRRVCASCSVRAECLAVALADDRLVGLWGGTSPTERHRIRAEAARRAAA